MILLLVIGFTLACALGAGWSLLRAAAKGDELGGYLAGDDDDSIPGATL